MSTNLIPQKPIRHIGLRRKHQQTKGSCAEVEGERRDHQFSCKCKKPKIAQGGALTYPLFTKNPSFVRRCDHLPTTLHGKGHKHVHKENVHKEKPRGRRRRWHAHLFFCLHNKNQKQEGGVARAHTIILLEMHSFTLIHFLKCIHSHLFLFFAKYT